MALFNAYLPGGKHESRRGEEIYSVYDRISEQKVPENRGYLKLEIAGEVIGAGKDFAVPTVKYVFRTC